jgi:hypothetical protein
MKTPTGRPTKPNVEYRQSLEKTSAELRTWSLGIMTASGGAGGVSWAKLPEGLPRGWSTAILCYAGALVILAFANGIPLPQTINPADKIAQLERTIVWRRRLVWLLGGGFVLLIILIAIGFLVASRTGPQ